MAKTKMLHPRFKAEQKAAEILRKKQDQKRLRKLRAQYTKPKHASAVTVYTLAHRLFDAHKQAAEDEGGDVEEDAFVSRVLEASRIIFEEKRTDVSDEEVKQIDAELSEDWLFHDAYSAKHVL